MTICIALFFLPTPVLFFFFVSFSSSGFSLLLDFGSLWGNLWSLHVVFFCFSVSAFLVSYRFVVICPSFPLLHLVASHFLLERKIHGLLCPWWTSELNWEGPAHTCCLTYSYRSICLSLRLWSSDFHYLVIAECTIDG